MKCKNCGGELRFSEGIGICENCGTRHNLDFGFEDIDVYICYVESDSFGRRTRDSIMAEEIYKKLENKKIHTFNQRILCEVISNDDIDAARYQAMYSAKIFLPVACSKENFEKIISKHSQYFKDKTIVPVYSVMNPYDIPESLQKLQALNYDAIGADSDLIKNVLKLLGREEEIEIPKVKNKGRNRALIIVIAVVVAAIICAVVLILVNRFGEEEIEEDPQQIYDEAVELMDNGEYLEAADVLRTIEDFQDSADVIKDIYDRYDGYYQSEEEGINFYINVRDAVSAEFTFEKQIDDGSVSLEKTASLEDNAFSTVYTDNLGSDGTITITLQNDSMEVATQTEDEASEIGNISVVFELSQKSDRPMEATVTSSTIEQWLSGPATITEIKKAGFDLEFVNYVTVEMGRCEELAIYKVANTDVQILFSDLDFSQQIYFDDYNISMEDAFEESLIDDYKLYEIIAPAELIYPDCIGKTCNAYTDENIIYIPFCEGFSYTCPYSDYDENDRYNWQYFCPYFEFDSEFYSGAYFDSIIEDSTLVGATSSKLIGEFNYNLLVEISIERYSIDEYSDDLDKNDTDYDDTIYEDDYDYEEVYE